VRFRASAALVNPPVSSTVVKATRCRVSGKSNECPPSCRGSVWTSIGQRDAPGRQLHLESLGQRAPPRTSLCISLASRRLIIYIDTVHISNIARMLSGIRCIRIDLAWPSHALTTRNCCCASWRAFHITPLITILAVVQFCWTSAPNSRTASKGDSGRPVG
jgi:hypothetical protein